MKLLRTSLLLVCAGLLVGSTMAFAEEKNDDAPPGSDTGPNCDVTGYKTERIVYPTPVPIPDNSPNGVLLGPIFMPADGDLVNDVVLELNAAHSWIGDIIMDLTYDEDCSGPLAGTTQRVLCRARGTQASPPPPCGTATGTFGCSGNLVATTPYLFSDDATVQMGLGALCTTNIAGGCYKQADVGGGPFSIWRGLLKGGCWYLRISDNAGADLGSVSGWAVYVRNQRPVPVVGASWGSVKGTYR